MFSILEYLAQRANMKIDDPRFDKDFFASYFKRCDAKKNKDVNKQLEEFLGIKR